MVYGAVLERPFDGNVIVGSNPTSSALTFLNDPPAGGEFRNDNALLSSLFEPCTNSTGKVRSKNKRADFFMSYSVRNLRIRPFEKQDQKAARQIILSGLGEHFGFIDATRNPDLDDIYSTYLLNGNIFVVALVRKSIVGTGGLVVDGKVCQMVRVSVKKQHRRHGIGKEIVRFLLEEAKKRAVKKIIIETEHRWTDAVGFYKTLGFTEYKRNDVDVFMSLSL